MDEQNCAFLTQKPCPAATSFIDTIPQKCVFSHNVRDVSRHFNNVNKKNNNNHHKRAYKADKRAL